MTAPVMPQMEDGFPLGGLASAWKHALRSARGPGTTVPWTALPQLVRILVLEDPAQGGQRGTSCWTGRAARILSGERARQSVSKRAERVVCVSFFPV